MARLRLSKKVRAAVSWESPDDAKQHIHLVKAGDFILLNGKKEESIVCINQGLIFITSRGVTLYTPIKPRLPSGFGQVDLDVNSLRVLKKHLNV